MKNYKWSLGTLLLSWMELVSTLLMIWIFLSMTVLSCSLAKYNIFYILFVKLGIM